MYYAFKESKVDLTEALNSLLLRFIVPFSNTKRALSNNTTTVDQLKNATYQLTQNDSYITGMA
jgi:hypothetical protein